MQTIGPYRVVRELGRGGMGVVYEVEHPQLPGRKLALKQNLAPDDQVTATRFLREAELLAKVTHPNVVRVVALDHAPSGPYLVTDLVEGEELATRAGSPVDPREAVTLVRDLSNAVEAVHAEGILHRDLKPQNVIVRPDGTPVLLDFGVARELKGERLTQTGSTLGTVQYMSPEQASGEPTNQLTARTDVYALGAILYFLLSGEAPFKGSRISVLTKVLTEDPPWPACPRELDAVLRQAMAKDRIARYPSAAALAADLDRFLAGEPVHAAPARRRRGWFALGVLSLGLAAGLAALGVTRADDAEALPPTEPAAASPAPVPRVTLALTRPDAVVLFGPNATLPERLQRVRLDARFLDDDEVLLWSAPPIGAVKPDRTPWAGVIERWALRPRPRRLERWQVPGRRGYVDALVFERDGTVIAAVQDQLYRIRSGAEPEPLGEPFEHSIFALALSPQRPLAIALRAPGQPLWTLDLARPGARPTPVEVPGGTTYRTSALRYQPDGDLLLGTAQFNRQVAGTGGESFRLGRAPLRRPEAAEVRILVPDGEDAGVFWVGTGAPQVIRVARTGSTIVEMPREADPNRSFKIRRSMLGAPRGLVRRGKRLFVISGSIYPQGNELRVWSLAGDEPRHVAAVRIWPQDVFLTSLDMSPDGARLLFGTQRRRGRPEVEVWPVAVIQGDQERSSFTLERP